ncbi:MAG: methyltransferase family protein [Acidobacteriota bacterium]
MAIRVKACVQAVVFLGLIAVALPYLASGWFEVGRVGPLPRAVGVLTAALGGGLAIWCIVLFVRVGEGTQAPTAPPKHLVTVGPYGVVRNPMLLGVTLLLAGEAIAFASLGITLYVVAFLAVTNLLMVLVEEPSLRKRFGTEYEVYRNAVPRWLPRLRRTAAASQT